MDMAVHAYNHTSGDRTITDSEVQCRYGLPVDLKPIWTTFAFGEDKGGGADLYAWVMTY